MRPPHCPKCGCTEFVVRYWVSGTIEVREDQTGATVGDNTQMWDSVRMKRTKAKLRCNDCGEKIKEEKDTVC